MENTFIRKTGKDTLKIVDSKKPETINIPISFVPIYETIHSEHLSSNEIIGFEPIIISYPEEYFFIKCKDDSMKTDRICEGDLILVHKQCEAPCNSIVVVKIDDEPITLKRLVCKENGYSFESCSGHSQFIHYSILNEHPDYMKIIGVVKEVIIRFNNTLLE